MSRRKRRVAAGKRDSAVGELPRRAAECPAAVRGPRVPHPARPRPWFLAITALLQGAWIIFLLVLAVRG